MSCLNLLCFIIQSIYYCLLEINTPLPRPRPLPYPYQPHIYSTHWSLSPSHHPPLVRPVVRISVSSSVDANWYVSFFATNPTHCCVISSIHQINPYPTIYLPIYQFHCAGYIKWHHWHLEMNSLTPTHSIPTCSSSRYDICQSCNAMQCVMPMWESVMTVLLSWYTAIVPLSVYTGIA